MADSDSAVLGRLGSRNVETGSARAQSLKGRDNPWTGCGWLLWPPTIINQLTCVKLLSITPKACLHLNRRDPRCPPSLTSPEAVSAGSHTIDHNTPRHTNRENRVVQPQRDVLKRSDQPCSSLLPLSFSYQKCGSLGVWWLERAQEDNQKITMW